MERKERTLVIIKPDGIQRTLIGEIIKRIERIGLKMVSIKMIIPDEDRIHKHYTVDPDWMKTVGEKTIKAYKEKGEDPLEIEPEKAGARVLKVLKKYMTSGPVVAMVWQGGHAVEIVRKIVGHTEPLASDVGTLRGDLVLDSYKASDTKGRAVRNLLHASGTVEDAEKEIDIWFKKEEISNYTLIQEAILYDVNLDGILE